MYFAVNQTSQIKEAYILFLNEILEKGNDYYEEIFRGIVKESKQLNRTKDFYAVSSERFDIVNLIAKNNELVTTLNEDNLGADDFEKLRGYLNTTEASL
jgi:hypothetical protein